MMNFVILFYKNKFGIYLVSLSDFLYMYMYCTLNKVEQSMFC